MTGLRCGRPRAADMADDKKAMKDFFTNERMTVGDLESAFKNSMVKEPSARRRFKLALLLIVEGVLLGGNAGKF